MQPGEGLVFVTRQAQSKTDKVLRGSTGAMADILRPFSELQEKKTKQQQQQRVAWLATQAKPGFSWGSRTSWCHHYRFVCFFFFPPQSDAVTDVPAIPLSRPGSSTLLDSSVRSFGGNKSKTLTSPSLADPPIQSRGTLRKSGLF